MAKRRNNAQTHDATVGYEAQLWQMADALRGSMDAAEYKHVVLGLIISCPNVVTAFLSPICGKTPTQCWIA